MCSFATSESFRLSANAGNTVSRKSVMAHVMTSIKRDNMKNVMFTSWWWRFSRLKKS